MKAAQHAVAGKLNECVPKIVGIDECELDRVIARDPGK
jgi:hypothetical protein